MLTDPVFPLIQLPVDYTSHRATRRVDLDPGQAIDLLSAIGPGCVRHFWITSKSPDVLDLEISCDGVQPQVRMKLHQFFGVLLGKDSLSHRVGAAQAPAQKWLQRLLSAPFPEFVPHHIAQQWTGINLRLVDGQLAKVRQASIAHTLPVACSIHGGENRRSRSARRCSALSGAADS